MSEEQLSEGGKTIAEIVKVISKSGTGNQMTPQEIADHTDEERQGNDKIKFTNSDFDEMEDLKQAFAELDRTTDDATK